ncbi:hydrogenase expression protein [Actinomadura decatromicini]|uniref:Hydrogenase expression protein n=1 Tax=Actinomadura decatromicini TaxID=2604572 RepID=A0A5D3FW08_9ACTN|nr:hydrogenase expression protein [Actinomadura decatromicini]TYK51325.1 hydrogenase expression protein [Actinomadura decatromicini]
MSIWSSLDPASATVDPGAAATVTLRLRNTTDLVEEYRVSVAGGPAVWAAVEPRSLRLYPGTTGAVEITFRPPRTPDAPAGGHPFAVEVIPTEQPGDKTVVEGHLTVTPFTEVRAELLPHTVAGRFRAKPKFALDNLGNTRLTASLTGKDNTGQLGFELHPANVQVDPGRAAWVQGRIRPGSITWFGQRESHPYTVNVLRSGVEPVEVGGVFVQRAVMPRWLLGFMGVLVSAAVAFTIAWFVFDPKFGSRARDGGMVPVGNPLSMPDGKPSKAPEPDQEPRKAPPAPPPGGGEEEPQGGDGGERQLGGPGRRLLYLSRAAPWPDPPKPDEQPATWPFPVKSPGFERLNDEWKCTWSSVRYTLCGMKYAYVPGSSTTFDFWVKSNGDPNASISVIFDWNFDGDKEALQRREVFKPFKLEPNQEWQKYTEEVGLEFAEGQDFRDINGGKLSVGFWVRSGDSPIEVRSNVPLDQDQISALRIPYDPR